MRWIRKLSARHHPQQIRYLNQVPRGENTHNAPKVKCTRRRKPTISNSGLAPKRMRIPESRCNRMRAKLRHPSLGCTILSMYRMYRLEQKLSHSLQLLARGASTTLKLEPCKGITTAHHNTRTGWFSDGPNTSYTAPKQDIWWSAICDRHVAKRQR